MKNLYNKYIILTSIALCVLMGCSSEPSVERLDAQTVHSVITPSKSMEPVVTTNENEDSSLNVQYVKFDNQ